MLYPFFYLMFFLLPGWLITGMLRLRAGRALLALAFSYSLLTVNLLVLQTFNARPALFLPLFALELVVLAVAAFLKYRTCPDVRRFRARDRQVLWPGVVLLMLTAFYLLAVGPYTEVPADVWEHLRRMQVQTKVLNTDQFIAVSLADLWLTQDHHWYFLQAVLCRLSGLKVMESLPYITMVNSLALAGGVYLFGLHIFARLRVGRLRKSLMAGLAGLFFIANFGVNVFSYLRYYALAPTMLCYLVYLACMILMLDFLRSGQWRWRKLWPIALFFVVLNVLHTQEALFVVFMTWSLGIVETVRRWRSRTCGEGWAWWFSPAPVFCVGGLAALLGLFFISRGNHLSPLWIYASIPLQDILPFMRNLLIQSPTVHFYPVIGFWGVLVFCLFIHRRREFSNLPFLTAGMLMPLLTVFNPLTVDIMLRNFSDPIALYRFNYMLPLPIVAAYCVLRRPAKMPGCGWSGYWYGVAVFAGLLVFLLPVRLPYFESVYSRLPTLRRVAPGNDMHQWGDLLEFMKELPPSTVIADPVTAYMLRGATQHTADGRRFDYSQFCWWLYPEEADVELQRIWGHIPHDRPWLLVINRRDGSRSAVGELSGHWPEDVLKVSNYYAPRTIMWVEAQPAFFRLIWMADRISVYEINRPVPWLVL